MFKNLSIRIKIGLGFLLIVLLVAVFGYFATRQINKIIGPIEKDIPESIGSLEEASYLDGLAQFIRYYDEVLTQSARNYAFTGDEKWKTRYESVVPELDKIIKEAIEKGHEEDKEFFSSVDAANVALVEMEEESILLVDNDQLTKAVGILESNEYWEQKEIYTKGLRDYIERRGADYNEALAVSTEVLDIATEASQNVFRNSTRLITIFIVIVLLSALVLGIVISYLITKPIIALKGVSQEVAKGDLTKRADVESNDEIGQLAQSFNKMTDNLQRSRANIEKKVADRTADLEKLNKSMIGRELKMMELKKEILKIKKDNN